MRDDLLVHLPGTASTGAPAKGDVFDDEVLAAAEEEVVDDQPSSSAASGSGRYLRVSDDLFVHLPGTASTGVPIEG